MIVLEDLKAVDEPALRGPQDRKIVRVLDVVMLVQLLQEELQARREPRMEFLRRHRPFAKLRRGVVERGAKLAETVVSLQPEARHLTQVGVRHPLAVGEAVAVAGIA